MMHRQYSKIRNLRGMYLEQADFMEETERSSLDEDNVANNFANASKVDASDGTSRPNEL